MELKDYKKSAEKFATEAKKELNGSISSIVLFGSVARGTATKDSDIDILVVGRGDWRIQSRLSKLGSQIDFDNDFDTLTTPMFFTMSEINRGVAGGSFFLKAVAREGIVLYDNGTFRRVREKIIGTGKRNA